MKNGCFFRLERWLKKCPIFRLFEMTSVAWICYTLKFLGRTILYYLDLVKDIILVVTLAKFLHGSVEGFHTLGENVPLGAFGCSQSLGTSYCWGHFEAGFPF